MLPLSPSTISSSSLDTKDAESAKTIGSPESLSPDEAARDCDSYLPFEIPGAVLLTAPSISVLRQAANDVCNRINSDTSYSNQFIIVSNISQPLQEQLGGDRNPLEVPYRLTLDAQRQQVVIRIMPSGAHERLTQSFTGELIEKLLDMGIRPRAYTLNAATRYQGRTCAKEADQSLTPSRDTFSDNEWPSLVIETGLSESEAQLRADVYWWFSNSDYQVNVVILFHIQRSPERRVTIKLYSLRPTTPRITRGLNAEAQRTLLSNPPLPQADSSIVLRHSEVHEIIITSRDVQNAPLELEFESVMRRHPAPNTREKNITFTAEDLAVCCSHVFLES
ncbi:hypothetical protein N7532_009475 [Penicillium argentinense]|uniref:Uncharacterized protein n=1 Tax=Penicillium argentinense TaxID=1131581 RepID=A0A9W9EZJ0_9EURO|nr:uncharacterized protein N7532_009475 [Penicillium argentinense]KAJ5090791.1 hypothetical protein N7532_009475 [Penicillium argentinense]